MARAITSSGRRHYRRSLLTRGNGRSSRLIRRCDFLPASRWGYPATFGVARDFDQSKRVQLCQAGQHDTGRRPHDFKLMMVAPPLRASSVSMKAQETSAAGPQNLVCRASLPLHYRLLCVSASSVQMPLLPQIEYRLM